MILGAAGNVGAYAVQFAANAKLHVVAVVGAKDRDYVRSLGAEGFNDTSRSVNAVIDTVGGATRERGIGVLKPGGILVSVVSAGAIPKRFRCAIGFFLR